MVSESGFVKIGRDERATTARSIAAPAVGKSSFYPVGFAVDQRPALDGTPVAGFPVGVFGFQDEAGIDDEMERGLILKADVNGMIPARGEDFDKVDGLAFDLFKAVESASIVTADCGLAAPGFRKSE